MSETSMNDPGALEKAVDTMQHGFNRKTQSIPEVTEKDLIKQLIEEVSKTNRNVAEIKVIANFFFWFAVIGILVAVFCVVIYFASNPA